MKAIKTNAAYVNREFPEMVARINEWVKNITENGPTRVYVDGNGYTPDRAWAEFTTAAEYALIRHDGWSLGYEAKDEDAAEDMWAGEWVARVDLITHEVDYLNAT